MAGVEVQSGLKACLLVRNGRAAGVIWSREDCVGERLWEAERTA